MESETKIAIGLAALLGGALTLAAVIQREQAALDKTPEVSDVRKTKVESWSSEIKKLDNGEPYIARVFSPADANGNVMEVRCEESYSGKARIDRITLRTSSEIYAPIPPPSYGPYFTAVYIQSADGNGDYETHWRVSDDLHEAWYTQNDFENDSPAGLLQKALVRKEIQLRYPAKMGGERNAEFDLNGLGDQLSGYRVVRLATEKSRRLLSNLRFLLFRLFLFAFLCVFVSHAAIIPQNHALASPFEPFRLPDSSNPR